MPVRQLFPFAVDDIDPLVVYGDGPVVAGRPAVRLNMIVSVDGGTSWNGVSGGLGGPADRQVFAAMRAAADMVLVAAGTMRAERYGPAVLPADVQDLRRTRGQRPVPPVAVVSRHCDFDFTAPFFADARERPIILTTASADTGRRRRARDVAEVVIAGEHDVDVHHAVAALARLGATSILAEGGPTLNGALARAGVLDEVCVTLAPLLASGDAKRLIAGSTLDDLERLQLRTILEADDHLFLRYRPVG